MKSGGLIGFGYWGQNLLRALKKIKPSLSLYVFDSSPKARRSTLEKGFFVCSSLTEILSKEISFLIIATPPA
ncbi:MAG: NAD(P)-binding domain-containing protein, partial [Oligoflexia bacterium]|nr:NAD(P)-binding domain-containing protein [Oligoflexia bacterium]